MDPCLTANKIRLIRSIVVPIDVKSTFTIKMLSGQLGTGPRSRVYAKLVQNP